MSKARRDVGIEVRHAATCSSRDGRRCTCEPRYRGHVKDPSGRKIRSRWTASKAEAIGWRQDAVVALRNGRLRPSTKTTVEEAGRALVEGMRTGAVLDRSGKFYKAEDDSDLRARARNVCPSGARPPKGELAPAV